MSSNGSTPPGFNKTKRQWARGFLWITSLLLIFDKPLFSVLTSASAVYTMHGGTWLSQKNAKWMGASIMSFVVSLYALTLKTQSNFVDEDRAYELKATLSMKHRAAEILWGGMLLLFLGLTIKEQIDSAIDVTSKTVDSFSSDFSNNKAKQK